MNKCSVCGEPKQRMVTLFGETRVVPVLCKCEAGERDKRKITIEDIKKSNKLKDIREKACPKEIMNEIKHKTFNNDLNKDTSVSKFSRNYANNWKEMRENNISVVFYGDVGVGKTYYAMCIANELMDNMVYVCITSISEILKTPIEHRDKFINSLVEFPLLIIDDLGTERNNAYANEILYTVVNSRYNAKKPIIFTTNYTKEDIVNKTIAGAERTFDRIEEMALFVRLTGESKRREIGNKKRDEAISLLYPKKN